MGTVSTALTEEALSECVKRTIYQSMPLEGVAISSNGDNDDVKCSICQVFFPQPNNILDLFGYALSNS